MALLEHLQLLMMRERLLYGNEALHLFVNQMLRFADLHDAICIIKHFQFVLNTSNHKLKESCAAEITLSAAVEDSVE